MIFLTSDHNDFCCTTIGRALKPNGNLENVFCCIYPNRRSEILTFWVQWKESWMLVRSLLSFYPYTPKLRTVWLTGGRCFALLWRALRNSVRHTCSGSWAAFWPNRERLIRIQPELCCLYQGKTDMKIKSQNLEDHVYFSCSLLMNFTALTLIEHWMDLRRITICCLLSSCL